MVASKTTFKMAILKYILLIQQVWIVIGILLLNTEITSFYNMRKELCFPGEIGWVFSTHFFKESFPTWYVLQVQICCNKTD